MLATTLGAALLTAADAYAQFPTLPSKIGPLNFSPAGQQSIVGVLTNGSFASCFKTADLLPILTANDSIIPYLDKFMTDLCSPTDVCTNATLNEAAGQILQGCSADLKADGFPDAVVNVSFSLYPLVRDVLCLKTADPYTAESYGGALGAPPIPVTDPRYNSTNGTFCVTSLLTQLSAYFQDNVTVAWITGAVTGQNQTAIDLITSIHPDILCNECIFGAVDLIAAAYPAVASVPLDTIAMALNFTLGLPPNATIATVMDAECAYKNYTVTTDGTLPGNITETAQNTTATASNSTASA